MPISRRTTSSGGEHTSPVSILRRGCLRPAEPLPVYHSGRGSGSERAEGLVRADEEPAGRNRRGGMCGLSRREGPEEIPRRLVQHVDVTVRSAEDHLVVGDGGCAVDGPNLHRRTAHAVESPHFLARGQVEGDNATLAAALPEAEKPLAVAYRRLHGKSQP